MSFWAGWPMPNITYDVGNGAPHHIGYADNGDGTITDKVTGLMWQKDSTLNVYVWADAMTACRTLNFAGYKDWRLPSEIELISLLDDTDIAGGPMIDTTYFINAQLWTWSSTPCAASPGYAWTVEFLDGLVYGLMTDKNGYARCVR